MTEEQSVAKFTLNKQIHVIRIDLKTHYALAEKYDFDVLKLFLDEQATRQVMLKLLLDTDFCLKLLWFFIEKKVTYGHDQMLEYVETADGLNEFKEAVWAAVVNFSNRLTRPMLLDMWKELKHEIRTMRIESETLTPSSSESEVEESQV